MRRRGHGRRRPPPSELSERGARSMRRGRPLVKSAFGGAAGAALPLGLYRPSSTPAAIQGSSIPLPLLPKARPVASNSYLITARPGTVQMHPSFGLTKVWGYDDNSGRGVASPGYTIEVQKGTPTKVSYVNALPAQHMFDNEVPDYMHAGTPVRMNTHLHGGYVAGSSDGNPYQGPAEFNPGQIQS